MKSVLYLIAVLLLCSCNNEDAFDCIKKTGKISSSLRDVDAFEEIWVDDNIEVVLVDKPSDAPLEIVAGKNLHKKIITNVENGALYLNNNNSCNWVREYDLPIQVKIPSQRDLRIHNNGYGSLSGTFSGDSLWVFNFNNAEDAIDLHLDNTDYLLFRMSYFGGVKFTGSTNMVSGNKNANCTGRLDCRSLIATEFWFTGLGKGEEHIYATDATAGSVTDSKLHLYGNPWYDYEVLGTGSVIIHEQ